MALFRGSGGSGTSANAGDAVFLPLTGGTVLGDIVLGDNNKIQFGASSTDCLTIKNTSSGDKEITETGSGNLKIKADYFEFVDSSDNKMFGTDGSSDVTLFVAGSDPAFKTSNASVDVIGRPLKVNDINEYTAGHGVEIDSVTLKDGGVNLGSGVTITSGANTPEGAVTAPVGSLFLRTNGGSNTTLYVKESGTGNTGWSAK